MSKVKPALAEIANTSQTLLALSQEALEIVRLIEQAGGEISPELESRLSVNSQSLMSKVDGYIFIEDQLEAQASLWKRRKDACAEVQKRFESRIEQLRGRVKQVMLEMGKERVNGNTNRYQLSRMKKPKLVITDEKQIPADFKMQITTTVVNKEMVLQALQDGFEVPGAQLEEVVQLRTYENSDKE